MNVIKKVVAVLIITLLVTGCTSGVQINIETGSPDIMPSEAASVEPSAPGSTPSESISQKPNTTDSSPSATANTSPNAPETTTPSPNEPVGTSLSRSEANAQKSYDELKAEFEDAIDQMKKAYSDYEAVDHHWTYYSQFAAKMFEEILCCRESLEDFNEQVKFPLGNDGYIHVLIDVKPVFMGVETNYRIITFDPIYLPWETVYIQVFDDNDVETYIIDGFLRDSGIWEFIEYSTFCQDLSNNYLIVISVQYFDTTLDDEAGLVAFSIVSFKLEGDRIINYHALKDEKSTDIWTVKKTDDSSFRSTSITNHIGRARIEITNSFNWPLVNYTAFQTSFDNSTFTIYIKNEEVDELVSLLFKNGFWEVVEIR